jgi:hypothetical protein
MTRIVIAHGHTSIEVFHSMTPLMLAAEKTNDKWSWRFVDYRIFNIFKMQGDLLILVRRYHDGKRSDEKIRMELLTLKKNFKKVVYFDDSAATSVILFNIFELVDEYWKRSVFKNLDLYTEKLYGGHLFSDYYHEKYSISDGSDSFFNRTSDGADLTKLKVAWNIGIGAFPLARNNILNREYEKIRRLVAGLSVLPLITPVKSAIKLYIGAMKNELEKDVDIKQKKKSVSGRFKSGIYRNSIGHQRVIMKEKIKNKNIFTTGKIDKWSFTQEAFSVRGMLSPFGWGEVCYRDFEAVIGGAVLIKPDMSHVETWPNIFTNKSYISLSWNLNELDSFDIDMLSVNSVNEARKIYLSSLNSMADRAIAMIATIGK